ncbi:MAG: type II toxin-antitoxin system HicA family toxin [bacterium]|nr:type II toxin-antitoxin system HicA family toxin [bacterium]
MSKRDKLRRKLRNNPKGVKFTELITLLLRFGFVLVRTQGRHQVFEYKQGDTEGIFVVPTHGNYVKAIYVKGAIELLDTLFPEGSDNVAESDDDEDA